MNHFRAFSYQDRMTDTARSFTARSSPQRAMDRLSVGANRMKIIVSLLIAGALWGALFASGIGVLVWRSEPYAGTEYLAHCLYVGAAGFTHIEHGFGTLAEMQRFECATWITSGN
jgi:hypothetical protein